MNPNGRPRKPASEKAENQTVRITPELKAQLLEIAKIENCPIAQVIRNACEFYIENYPSILKNRASVFNKIKRDSK